MKRTASAEGMEQRCMVFDRDREKDTGLKMAVRCTSEKWATIELSLSNYLVELS